MFMIAKATFNIEAKKENWHSCKEYEYYIPKEFHVNHYPPTHLVGHLAIVSKLSTEPKINNNIVRIIGVERGVDGVWEGDYAQIIGVVSDAAFLAGIERQRKKERLRHLIEKKKNEVARDMQIEALANMSPELAELIKEYKAL